MMDFEALYQVYFMQVYSYVMTIMKNKHLSEEITQEVFFRALKNERSYRAESSELTWLCTIAKNLCNDFFRKHSRHKEVALEETVQDAADSTQVTEGLIDSHSVEQMVEDENMTLVIHRILHQMDEPYKEVFQLRVFGELSFDKIGRIFGKTENWARVTYHRARLKVMDRLD